MHASVIFETFKNHRNEAAAIQMAAYMKNKFPFLGIKSPDRRLLGKAFLKEKSKSKMIDWDFIVKCFDLEEREYQYLALDYLILMKKYYQKEDIDTIERLIQTKSWWDTVDGFDQIVGTLVINNPELKETHVRKWITSPNIWLVRVSIDFQLEFKEKTDPQILSESILANLGNKEFFINKAIGWSLRQYSKTNQRWVTDFVNQYKTQMHPLSVREASKYL